MKPLYKFLSNRISLPPGLLDYVGVFFTPWILILLGLCQLTLKSTDTEVQWAALYILRRLHDLLQLVCMLKMSPENPNNVFIES